MSLCVSLAHVTETIPFGPTIEPIYLRHPADLAAAAAYIHEISGGRFRLGIGVSHGPVHERLGVQAGKPLQETRHVVETVRGAEKQVGPTPPIILATLRDKMLALAAEIADGAVWANGSLSHMEAQLSKLPADKRDGSFVLLDMVPTTIDDDRDAAAAVNRRTLSGYVTLPNYRNYWKAAGYQEEMEAIEAALAAGDRDKLPGLMTDKWLSDCTLYGSVSEVREGVERWYAAGVTPILVPSSTSGGQMKAIEELFAAFS
jgi:alkanesulfonate monooxygenase SsuD/methylene tetrahydromethanopterin reductase-like flavin-dependent oxidoreductase (luciferase family)